MSEKKVYRAQTGVELDPSFEAHVASCEQCQRFKTEEPVTASLLCLEGAVLWKRENRVPSERVTAQDISPNRVSKAAAKKLMVYK